MREFVIQILTSDQFVAFLVAGVFAALGAAGKVAISWWKSRKLTLTAQQLDLLHRFADVAVAVVDQTLKSKTNAERIAAAIAAVQSDLEDYGITIADQERIRRAVEAAVRRARTAQVLAGAALAPLLPAVPGQEVIPGFDPGLGVPG